MPLTLLGFFRNVWKIPHSPWPVVAPNDARLLVGHVEHDRLRRADRDLRSPGRSRPGRRSQATFLLPVAKPPCSAHAFAAGGVARNFTNASIAGRVVERDEQVAADLDGARVRARRDRRERHDVEAGVRPSPSSTRGSRRETKSASNTIAAFGGVPNAFVTESLKPYWSAPLVPPAMFDVSPMILRHRLQRRDHRRVGPLDLVRGQLVVLRRRRTCAGRCSRTGR